jgi:hypothetical protein
MGPEFDEINTFPRHLLTSLTDFLPKFFLAVAVLSCWLDHRAFDIQRGGGGGQKTVP